nr:SDR family NAD(P)-dependent oxidoreductase [Candidatus Solirubrobacter pratensis]
MTSDLGGQLAVVTGARRGIGLAFAEALAAAGADVAAVSRSLEPEGSEPSAPRGRAAVRVGRQDIDRPPAGFVPDRTRLHRGSHSATVVPSIASDRRHDEFVRL